MFNIFVLTINVSEPNYFNYTPQKMLRTTIANQYFENSSPTDFVYIEEQCLLMRPISFLQ